MGNQYEIPVTIASGQSKSARVNIPTGAIPVGLFSDSAQTGTAFSFSAFTAPTGGTEDSVVDGSGNPVSITMGAAQYAKLDANTFSGIPYLTVNSNQTEAAQRNLIIVCQNA